jgi:hypothetical protein
MAISDDHQAKADPELVRQLDDAASDALVDAVFVLDATDAVLPAGAVEEAVRRLVERAESETGRKVLELSVFPNLASFVVRAAPQLVEELIAQHEVGSAVANRQPGSASL